MKSIFLTSDTKHYHKNGNLKIANQIDNTNCIVSQIKQDLKKYETILFIASDPNGFDKIFEYSKLLFEALSLSGINFDNYLVLDNRTAINAKKYISEADLIFLSGGDTFIQNQFFKSINLKELLSDYNGVIIGQSAGSINLAENVYNSPEDGENSEGIYFEGLGLTNINIEPHFQFDTSEFDEYEIYQRNHILKESCSRPIYAICDGSHVHQDDRSIVIYGKSYIIENGIVSLVCDDKESFNILLNKGKNI